MKLFVAIVENNNLDTLINRLLEAKIHFKDISFHNPDKSPTSTLLIEGGCEKDIINILRDSMNSDEEYYLISEPPFELYNGKSNTFILNLGQVYQIH